MRVKTIIDEDFVNYKKPTMYIGTCSCGGKCCVEAGIPVSTCQNYGWNSRPTIDVPDSVIIHRYLDNRITKAVCFAGLEPFEQFEELMSFVSAFRDEYGSLDDIVIYTGYNKDEISAKVSALSAYPNIIIKFGRYVPGDSQHYDPVLGVMLASRNQYAEQIS